MSELLQLDAAEQRVLGSLLEKQRTVPASYPLTLNSLRTACNQLNSREPVTDYSEADVTATLKALKDADLVRFVWAGKGSRAVKYHQLLEETLALQPEEAALVTVLLLRGAQSSGELRTRTERLHPFADREAVEATLRGLATRAVPLVRELPAARGQHDSRWIHLLGPVVTAEPTTEAAVDLEAPLAAGAEVRDAAVQRTYDTVAAAYAERFADELDHKPFDRWLLRRVAFLAGDAPVIDVGTGSGEVAGYLADEGCEVTGVDLSPEMVAVAAARFPAAEFVVGDLRRLLKPRTASGYGAITAWYAMVHHTPSELTGVLSALARVLVPGGHLAIALHAGPEVRHLDEFLGHEVDVDFVLHDPASVLASLDAAGFDVLERYVRGPIAVVEEPTDRLYVLAQLR